MLGYKLSALSNKWVELNYILLVANVCSHCLHREVISAGKFCWLASGAEPSLFFKVMSMAT